MDLHKLKAAVSTEVELIHPVDGSTGVVVTLASRDHEAVQAAARAIADKRLALLAKRRTKALKAEDLEVETLDVLCASVLGWEGLESGGEAWPCTPGNVRELLEANPWIRRQLNAAQEDEALFFGR